ncbi:MAG: LysR family transcriptional regulator [Akkermansiaceae bacterium]|nr:LysR family transcriptional regulator [Akkermansiaceae bacterium]
MMELPDLRQARLLVAVAETESFTKAAERLNVTQSAVSHSIRALETQLETTLIERRGKRLSLTQEGMVLLRRFKLALKQLEAAGDDLALLKRWGQGRLRVGATDTLCHYLLPEVLREFRKLYPRCEIHLDSGDTSQLVDLLDHAEIDLALGIDGRCPSWARFEGIFRDELVFVFSPEHEWAQLKEIDMEAMEGQSFLVYAKASETYHLLKESFEKAGGRLRSGLSLGDMGAIMEMAKVGIGVGIVAPWVARKEIEEGELISMSLGEVRRSRDWGVICHESRHLSMVEEDFLRICRKVTGGFPDVVSLSRS